jgi:gluconate kinase
MQPGAVADLDGVTSAPKALTARMDTYFVYCKGTKELLTDRISKRKNHFMGAQVSF